MPAGPSRFSAPAALARGSREAEVRDAAADLDTRKHVPSEQASIRLFVTGGTFDKDYDEIHGTLHFGDTHLPEMLQMARSKLDVRVRP